MVDIENLLQRVQQAESETGRQRVLLDLQMSQMPDALVSMLWAAAIPHFFDAKVLAALRPDLANETESLFADLQALTFVEEFLGHGCNIHELTRKVLLGQLWEKDREDYLELSKRAADYFFNVETVASSEEEAEFFYHEIVNEGTEQTGRLLERLTDWWKNYQTDLMQSALQGFLEHKEAERLDAFGCGFSFYLKGLIKMRSISYAEAGSNFKRARSIYEDVKPKNPRYFTTLLIDLGNSQKYQCRYNEAEPLYQQALAMSQQLLGEQHLDTANSLNSLAELYYVQGRYSEAEPLYQQALATRQQPPGRQHHDIAISLNNLAGLYQSQGRYSEAEPLYQQALAMNQQLLGEQRPYVAASLNNIAELYRNQGRYSEAEPLYHQALAMQQQSLGERHPNIAIGLNNLAELYRNQGQYNKAEPLYRQALTMQQQLLGEQHPDVAVSLNNLAELYRIQGRYGKAELLYQQALAMRQQLWREQHPDVAVSLNNLATFYYTQGRYGKAEPLYQQALAMNQQLLGNQHPRTQLVRENLRSLLKKKKKKKKKGFSQL